MPLLQVQGSRSSMSYIEETDWGAGPPATSPYWTGLQFVRESLKNDINIFQSNTIRGDRMTGAILRGNRRADGDIVCELGPRSHNLLLRHVTGGDWVTTGAAAPFVHRLTPKPDGELPPGGLCINKVFGDLIGGTPAGPTYLQYRGARVDSATFDIPQEGIATLTARFMTRMEEDPQTAAITPTPVIPPGDPYESNITAVTLIPSVAWATVAAMETDFDNLVTNPPIAIAAGGRFSITNQLDGNSYVLNSYSRYSVPAGRRRCEGSWNLLFKDFIEYERYKDGVPMACRVRYQNNLSGATAFTEFYFPSIKYAGPSPTPAIDGEQGVRYDLPFQAFAYTFGDGVASDVLIRVQNDEAKIIKSSATEP